MSDQAAIPPPVGVGMQAPAEHPARSGRLRMVVGLAISAGAIYTVVSSAGGFADSFRALSNLDARKLGIGAPIEAASFAVSGPELPELPEDAFEEAEEVAATRTS